MIHNKLPKAQEGTCAVLFVINAESSELYKNAKFKLVDNFKDSITEIKDIPFIELCLKKEKVKKYNINDKQDIQKLLNITNCLFFVYVRYTADDITNSENFELRIDYNVRHPEFKVSHEAILSHDMEALKEPIDRQNFTKSQTINIFNSTTQALIYTCQYMVGVVCLISHYTEDAYKLFDNVQKSLKGDKDNLQIKGILNPLVSERIYETLAQKALDNVQLFKDSKDMCYLLNMNKALDEANTIRPDTYFYNLNKAYIHILLNSDIEAAKSCVEKCKKLKKEKEWVYSDAFLSAYACHDPGVILSKYKKAFEVEYDNLVDIVDYIEFVLQREPKKSSIHLAAALVYEELDDYVLMKQHLNEFLACSGKIDKRSRAIINGKLSKNRIYS